MILTPLQKLPKNVGDLGKLIVPKGFKKLPKVKKSPNLVTLLAMNNDNIRVRSFFGICLWLNIRTNVNILRTCVHITDSCGIYSAVL